MRWFVSRFKGFKPLNGINHTTDVFAWNIAAIYLFAFASLYHQIPGLYGNEGILPVRAILKQDGKSLNECISERPTLLWFADYLGLDHASMMEFIALFGIGTSIIALLTSRFRDTFTFIVLWICYFSLYQAGQIFLWYQWDILLLETGFLAILVVPLQLCYWKTPVSYRQHDDITFWLVKWLLFRFMFASGIVKLTSQCPTWWGLTALQYHFESQCIPTPFAWFAHHLPGWFLKLGVVATFLVEIPIPFLFFSPVRSLRYFSFYAQVLFQIFIIITGNFNFFNLLTIILCTSLLDDDFLSDQPRMLTLEDYRRYLSRFYSVVRFFKRVLVWTVYFGLIYWTAALFGIQLRPDFSIHSEIAFTWQQFNEVLEHGVKFSIWLGAICLMLVILRCLYKSLVKVKGTLSKLKSLLGTIFFGFVAVWMFCISLVPYTTLDNRVHSRVWPIIFHWHRAVDKFHLVNSYGLFRVMTGVGGRPEVSVEGSFSGDSDWQPYDFYFKPARLDTSPPIVIPHQPRLDWQMWFAALGKYKENPWFVSLVYRLLKNQKEVVDLFAHNPFPKDPPKFIRARRFKYRYSPFDSSKRKKNPHHWWKRKRVGDYMPSMSLQNVTVIQYLKNMGIIGPERNETASGSHFLKRILKTTRDFSDLLSAQSFILSVFFTALAIRAFQTPMK